ncbi:MAG: NYN domain-containing protein [Candidatus Taylorbacteria bacterium]
MEKVEKQRVAIFIDGGNFYRKIRQDNLIPKGTRFNYVKFAEFLARGRTVSSKGYYIGIVRNHDNTDKSKKMLESQQKLLNGLENEGYQIKKGRIVYDNKIREKGVDVQLAIDLVIGAVENCYDIAIIVSSDTDLIPAIRYIKSKGKTVEYVGFSNAPSLAMIKESDNRILLLKEQVEALRSNSQLVRRYSK